MCFHELAAFFFHVGLTLISPVWFYFTVFVPPNRALNVCTGKQGSDTPGAHAHGRSSTRPQVANVSAKMLHYRSRAVWLWGSYEYCFAVVVALDAVVVETMFEQNNVWPSGSLL